MGEQVEHRLDAHLGECPGSLRPDAPDPLDRDVGQPAEQATHYSVDSR